MTVQYPAFLWFLLAILIPILIHLFYFRRIKKVAFSNLSFLKSIEQKTTQTKKLKRILILLSRILFIAALVWTFAELVRNSEISSPNRPDVLFIDNSASMMMPTVSSLTGINEAVKLIDNQLLSSEQDDRYFLLTNDFETLRARYPIDLKNDLATIEQSTQYRTLDEVMDYIQHQGMTGRVIYISDFLNLNEAIPMDSLTVDRLELVQVIPDVASNVFIDSVYFENLYYNPVFANKLIIRLKMSGKPDTRETTQIRILNEKQLIYAGQVALTKGATTLVEVPIDADMLRSPRLEIIVEDFPVAFDNSHFVVIPDYDKPTVTYLYKGQSPSTYFTSVFSNDQLFDFQADRMSQIDYARLGESDLIILDEVQKMPGFLSNLSNCSILIVPSDDLDISSLGWLQSKSISRIEDVYSAKLRGDDLKESFFSGVFDQIAGQSDLPRVKILYKPARYDEVILSDQFKEPFLTRHINTQQGISYYFVGSPMGSSYTNLPVHSLFVPLMYQLAFSSSRTSPILSYRADQRYLELPIMIDRNKGTIEVSSESLTFIPNQINNQEGVVLELPSELKKPGYYYLIQQQDTIRAFALNISKKESMMNLNNELILEAMAASSERINYTRLEEMSAGYTLNDSSTDSLWKYTLALALFFLTAEVLLARFL